MRRGLHFHFRSRSASATSTAPGSGALSDRARRRTVPTLGLLLFFGVFFLMGSALLYVSFIRPVLAMQAARSWTPTPAVVQSSEVVSHSGGDGTTYSIRIVYTYTVGDDHFTSERYDFMTGSSSGHAGKQAVVNQHPPGAAVTCYVDPADPTQAVLHRGWPRDIWFGLIPALFALVGLGGIVGTLWSMLRTPSRDADIYLSAARGAQRPDAAAFLPDTTHHEQDTSGFVNLKPATSRAGALGCLLAFALFWNGFIAFFAWNILDRSGGAISILALLFLIPFAGIGLLLIGAVVYQALALANPSVTVQARAARIALGQPLEIAWHFTGDVQRIAHLRVALEGVEKATYTRGTDTTTDTRAFARFDLADTDHPQQIAHGRATLTIPLDTMHSFHAPRNEIAWSLRLHGKIHRWPDVNAEYALVVEPAALAALAAPPPPSDAPPDAPPDADAEEEGQP